MRTGMGVRVGARVGDTAGVGVVVKANVGVTIVAVALGEGTAVRLAVCGSGAQDDRTSDTHVMIRSRL